MRRTPDATRRKVMKLADKGKNSREIEEVTGIHQGSVRRIIAEERGQTRRTVSKDRHQAAAGPRYVMAGTPADREIIKLKAEVHRLNADLKTAHLKSLDDEAMREILCNLRDAPSSPPTWLVKAASGKTGLPEVPMVSFADWHAGETVRAGAVNGANEFNRSILRERVKTLVAHVKDLAKNHHGAANYPGIIVNLLGDFVSGGLHPELLKTDEYETLPAILEVVDLLLWALQSLADDFGLVYAPAVCGNHGRLTHKPELKRYVYKNADWAIYRMLIKRLADRGDDRIKVEVREANEVPYRVWDMRFLAMHGDMMGVKGGDGIIGAIGPIMRGEIKTQRWAESSGIEYDHLEIGHWHQELWLPRVTVSNTLKGYCDFAKSVLRAPISAPSQALKFIHPVHGITSRWNVRVEANKKPLKRTDWVSVFGGRAMAPGLTPELARAFPEAIDA